MDLQQQWNTVQSQLLFHTGIQLHHYHADIQQLRKHILQLSHLLIHPIHHHLDQALQTDLQPTQQHNPKGFPNISYIFDTYINSIPEEGTVLRLLKSRVLDQLVGLNPDCQCIWQDQTNLPMHELQNVMQELDHLKQRIAKLQEQSSTNKHKMSTARQKYAQMRIKMGQHEKGSKASIVEQQAGRIQQLEQCLKEKENGITDLQGLVKRLQGDQEDILQQIVAIQQSLTNSKPSIKEQLELLAQHKLLLQEELQILESQERINTPARIKQWRWQAPYKYEL